MLLADFDLETPELAEGANRDIAQDQRSKVGDQPQRGPGPGQGGTQEQVFDQRPDHDDDVEPEENMERPFHFLLARDRLPPGKGFQ